MAAITRFSRMFLRPLNVLVTTVNSGRRSLYAETVLGLDAFDQSRKKASIQFHEMKDRFIGRMEEFVKSDVHGLVFTDDLKNVILLAEDNTKDVALAVQMLKKFHSQNKDLRFGNFIFGPVVMRMLYKLDEPDTAFQLITDPTLYGFFDQVASFTIVMDLLFVKQRYKDVLSVYEVAQIRQPNAAKFPRDPTVLALAACYKLNTADSLQVALKILRGARESAAVILRKGITFASALAIKQKDPQLALEILSSCNQTGYFTVRNLRVLAFAELERLDDVILELKFILERDSPQTKENNEIYCREILDVVKATAERLQNKEHIQTLTRLEQALQEHGWICPTNLDDALCAPVTTRPDRRNPRLSEIGSFESRFFANRRTASFNSNGQNFYGGVGGGSPRHRKGLEDLDD